MSQLHGRLKQLAKEVIHTNDNVTQNSCSLASILLLLTILYDLHNKQDIGFQFLTIIIIIVHNTY